jgi:hypothetical protein
MFECVMKARELAEICRMAYCCGGDGSGKYTCAEFTTTVSATGEVPATINTIQLAGILPLPC